MRTHSLKTGYLIHNVLVNDLVINGLLNEKVFLIVAEENTDFPYCIITRSGIISGDIDKDGFLDTVNFNIRIYSDKIEDCIEIADKIRFKLENNVLSYKDLQIYNIEMTSSSEAWTGEAYFENMDFRCEAENIPYTEPEPEPEPEEPEEPDEPTQPIDNEENT